MSQPIEEEKTVLGPSGGPPVYQAANVIAASPPGGDSSFGQWIWMKPGGGISGEETVPVRVPITEAKLKQAQGWSPVIDEDMVIRNKALEMSKLERLSAVAGAGAPIIKSIDQLIYTQGMSDAERRDRERAAELYTDAFSKNAAKVAGFALETVGVGKAASLVEKGFHGIKALHHAGKYAPGVAAGGVIGAGVGAADTMNMYLQDNKVSAGAMVANVAGHAIGSAVATGLIEAGSDGAAKIIKNIARNKTSNTAIAEMDTKAAEILRLSGFSEKAIAKEVSKGPGAAQKYALEARDRGLIKGTAEEAHTAIFAKQASTKAELDAVAAEVRNSGLSFNPSEISLNTREVADDLIRGGYASQTKTIKAMQTDVRQNLKGLIDEEGRLNFDRFRKFKTDIAERAKFEGRASTGNAKMKEKFFQDTWKRLDDMENALVGKADPSGKLLARLQSAQKDYGMVEKFKAGLPRQMQASMQAATSNMTENLNLGLTAFFAAMGNPMGVAFNAGWAAVRHVAAKQRSPMYLLSQIDPSMKQGVAKGIAKYMLTEAQETAAHQVAHVVGHGAVKKAEAYERSEADKAIYANVETIRNAMNVRLGTQANLQEDYNMFDPLAQDDAEYGQAVHQAVERVHYAAQKYLPKAPRARLLDNADDAEIPMSDMDRERATDVMSTIMDPIGALETPSPLKLRVLADAYPEIMNAARQRIVEEVTKKMESGYKFNLDEKQHIGMLLSIDASGETDGQFNARLQKFLAERAKQAEAPPSRPSSSFGKSLSKAAQTTAERVGNL